MNNLGLALDEIINSNLGTTYSKLPNQTTDSQAKSGAQKIVQAIKTAKDAILAATKDGTDSARVWEALMVDGIAPAMNFLAYDRGGSGDVDLRVKRGTNPPTFEINLGDGSYVDFDPSKPAHAEIANQIYGGKAPKAAA